MMGRKCRKRYSDFIVALQAPIAINAVTLTARKMNHVHLDGNHQSVNSTRRVCVPGVEKEVDGKQVCSDDLCLVFIV